MERAPRTYRFADCELDERAVRLTRQDRAVPLRPRVLKLLRFFLENPQRLITKDELVERVWEGAFVTDNAIARAVARLRSALDDDPRRPRFLETVHGEGYRFLAPVESTAVAPSEATPAAAKESPLPPRLPVLKTRAIAIAVVLIVILLGALVARVRMAGEGGAGSTRALVVVGAPRQLTTDTGMEIFPSVSPSGGAVAYTSDRSGSLEIYVRSLSPAARDLQLTDDGRGSQHPAWSPDGEEIAFHRRDDGIWIVPSRGGTARQVTSFGARPAWSPDGRTLVFHQGTGGYQLRSKSSDQGSVIWELDLVTGETRPLTRRGHPAGNHGRPVYHPSGEEVIFVAEAFHFDEIWSVDRADGRIERVLDAGSDPTLGPSGRLIFYRREDLGVQQWMPAASEPEPLPLQPGPIRHPSVSGDEAVLAYSQYKMQSNLWSLPMDAETSAPLGPATPLTQATNRNMTPVLSADGKRLVYFRSQRSLEWELWLLDLETSDAQLVYEGAARSDPAWVADDVVLTTSSSHVLRIDLATRRPETVAELGAAWEAISFSRDGGRLAFHQEIDGQTGVWVAEVGEAPQRLNDDPRFQGWPKWSPDGSTLAIEIRDDAGDLHVGIVPSAGGAARQLSFEPGTEYVGSWSPDGSRIVFAASRDNVWNLFWVAVDDGSQRQLTHYETPMEQGHVRYPEWSPAGDAIVFEQAQFTADVWVASLELR